MPQADSVFSSGDCKGSGSETWPFFGHNVTGRGAARRLLVEGGTQGVGSAHKFRDLRSAATIGAGAGGLAGAGAGTGDRIG